MRRQNTQGHARPCAAAARRILLVLLACAAPAAAQQRPAGQPQQQDEQSPADAAVTLADRLAQAEALPPPRRLGALAYTLRQIQQSGDMVVVTPSAREAAEVIDTWLGPRRFPVLIDDGSRLAAEHIGRFIRAYQPANIFRYQNDDPEPLPDDPAALRRLLTRNANTAMGARRFIYDAYDTGLALRNSGVPLHGAVVLDTADPAWIAGYALAIARWQPMLFVDKPPGFPDGVMSLQDERAFAGRITAAADEAELIWRTLGDDIDALTIAMNIPTRVRERTAEGEGAKHTALTDRLARHNGGTADRWAYAGIILGDSHAALYTAMCSIFLEPRRAWLFDGYTDTEGFADYDLAPAAAALRENGFSVNAIDLPANGIDQWRAATARGVDAGLLMVNTSGQPHDFFLNPGRGRAGDMPLLTTPAAAHVIHSWSAQRPTDPRTLAGRFFDRGVYAYFGSAEEPFLQAFIPPRAIPSRLFAGMPASAAFRLDSGPPWKLNYFGDPLLTIVPGDPADRVAGTTVRQQVPPQIRERAGVLEDRMKRRTLARDFPEAMRLLVMLGLDDRAARLARAIAKDTPDRFTPELAAAAIPALHRRGDHAGVLDAAERLGALFDESDDNRPNVHDTIWASARVEAGRGESAKAARTLKGFLRRGQEADDAIEVGAMIRASAGGQAAADYLRSVIGIANSDAERDAINRAANAHAAAGN